MFANHHQKLSVSFNAVKSQTAASMAVFVLYNIFNISFVDGFISGHYQILANSQWRYSTFQ